MGGGGLGGSGGWGGGGGEGGGGDGGGLGGGGKGGGGGRFCWPKVAATLARISTTANKRAIFNWLFNWLSHSGAPGLRPASGSTGARRQSTSVHRRSERFQQGATNALVQESQKPIRMRYLTAYSHLDATRRAAPGVLVLTMEAIGFHAPGRVLSGTDTWRY